ncbi:hypothetical protein Tco_0098947 [Tanacetum coccineum]
MVGRWLDSARVSQYGVTDLPVVDGDRATIDRAVTVCTATIDRPPAFDPIRLCWSWTRCINRVALKQVRGEMYDVEYAWQTSSVGGSGYVSLQAGEILIVMYLQTS